MKSCEFCGQILVEEKFSICFKCADRIKKEVCDYYATPSQIKEFTSVALTDEDQNFLKNLKVSWGFE